MLKGDLAYEALGKGGLAGYRYGIAPVVELVDALDSKSSTVRCVGSSPTGGTIRFWTRAIKMQWAGGSLTHLKW